MPEGLRQLSNEQFYKETLDHDVTEEHKDELNLILLSMQEKGEISCIVFNLPTQQRMQNSNSLPSPQNTYGERPHHQGNQQTDAVGLHFSRTDHERVSVLSINFLEFISLPPQTNRSSTIVLFLFFRLFFLRLSL